MRPLPLVIVAAILVGCGASSAPPNTPPTVNLPPAPTPTSAAPQPTPPPPPPRPRHPRASIAERISEHLRAASAGQRSLESEPSGRVVIKDVKEPLEEEFHLGDVERVIYDHEAGRRQPHWVKVYIKSSGVDRTRWRKGNAPWQIVTSPFLVLPLKDKSAADDVVTLMQSLAAP